MQRGSKERHTVGLYDQGGTGKVRTSKKPIEQNAQIIRRHFRRHPHQEAPTGMGVRILEPKTLTQVGKGRFDHLACRTPPAALAPDAAVDSGQTWAAYAVAQ